MKINVFLRVNFRALSVCCYVPSLVHCLLPHQQGDIAARANGSKNNGLWICMMYIGHAFITVVFSYPTLTRFYPLIVVHNALYLLLFALACISPEGKVRKFILETIRLL